MSKRTDCKRFEIIKNIGIQDNLTGELMMTMQDCCRVLNKTDERANKVVEDTYEELYRLKYKRDCRLCIHYACDSADNYCMKKEYDSLESVDDAMECKYYEV